MTAERTVRVDLVSTYRLPGSSQSYGPGKGVLVPYSLAEGLGLVEPSQEEFTNMGTARTARSSRKKRPQAGAGTPKPKGKRTAQTKG